MALRHRDWGWLVLMVVIVIWGGQIFNHVDVAAKDAYGTIAQVADDRYEVERAIMRYYVEEIDPVQLQLSEIDGMINELDTFSDFLSEREQESLRETTEGAFGGLGIQIYPVDHYPTVIAPLEDTPAWRVGLQPGDQIIAIEGESTYDEKLDLVVGKLRGVPGTAVNITIRRPGVSDPLEVNIVRAEIHIDSVVFAGMVWDESADDMLRAASPDWLADGKDVGYIRLRSFGRGAADEVRAGLEAARSRDATGIILDMRSNPGGLLPEARDVADLFLPRGQLIVSTKGKSRFSEQRLYSERDPAISTSIPVVVLVDEGSASASEIVAGAIQDNDRGLIIGRNTYGKGSVQTVYDSQFGTRYGLDFSENAMLKMTTAYYYSPSGRNIHRPRWRDGDRGAVVSKAESDTAFYETLRGRRVRGGGGIAADVEVAPDIPPTYYWQLRAKRLIFNYAVEYAVQHPEITPAEFVVTDDMIAEFEQFLADTLHEFTYNPQGRPELGKFTEAIANAGYDDSISEHVAKLEELLQAQEESQYDRAIPYIRYQMLSAIAGKLWSKGARVRAEFTRDAGIEQAVQYLRDQERYVNQLAASPPVPDREEDESTHPPVGK
jgi:carboxyl-terminal processing protease